MIRRLAPLVPLLALAAVLAIFTSTGGSLVDLIGTKAPPRDELQIRRVQLDPGEIHIRVTNPQHDEITIGSVAIDDAIVPFDVDGARTLKRLRSSTIVVPYNWVENDPLTVGVTSSTGIQVTKEIPAAVVFEDEHTLAFMDAGQVIESNTPENFFANPQHARMKLFLSQILRH